LAFQSWRVAAVLSHCITEKRRQSHPVDSRSKISGGSLREHEMAAGDLAVFVVSRGGSHRGDRVASNAATIAFEAYQLVADLHGNSQSPGIDALSMLSLMRTT
jgi:hypothetical protein